MTRFGPDRVRVVLASSSRNAGGLCRRGWLLVGLAATARGTVFLGPWRGLDGETEHDRVHADVGFA